MISANEARPHLFDLHHHLEEQEEGVLICR